MLTALQSLTLSQVMGLKILGLVGTNVFNFFSFLLSTETHGKSKPLRKQKIFLKAKNSRCLLLIYVGAVRRVGELGRL